MERPESVGNHEQCQILCQRMWLFKGFKYFRLFANHKINKDAYSTISIKEASLKYKIAAGMMKCHLFLMFYVSICMTLLLKKDMTPME